MKLVYAITHTHKIKIPLSFSLYGINISKETKLYIVFISCIIHI